MTYRIITNLPTVGADNDQWGTELNQSISELDAASARVVDVYDKTTADGRFVRTINGVAPDATGDVAVAGGTGGGGTTTVPDGSVSDASIVTGGLSPSSITGTAIVATDTRLSDSRTPTSHAASHATGASDPISPSQIGALAVSARGVANGVAPLGVSALVPENNLPPIVKPGSGTNFRLWVQSTAPTAADGAIDGDVWIQTA